MGVFLQTFCDYCKIIFSLYNYLGFDFIKILLPELQNFAPIIY